jgi:hypothetical protein
MRSITTLYRNPLVQVGVLTLYYLAILCGVLLVSSHGGFTTPGFVYQGF